MPLLHDLYRIDQFIDTFALGHYARVVDATDHRTGTRVAFKVLRPEHVAKAEEPRWEYRAFPHEADLLLRAEPSPHVIRLLDCGYISASEEAPAGGEIESFGRDAAAVTAFNREVIRFSARGWRPYLTLEHLPRLYNLFYLMRPDRAGTRLRLPTEEGVALAIQFAETLRVLHRAGVAYLDHKLEHVYWDGTTFKLIDLNSSRLLGDEADALIRADVHNLCVGILYPAFTGLSPQKTALKPQPGSTQEVMARYQDITTLDFGSEPTLSQPVQDVLQRGAAQQIPNADEFLRAMQHAAARNGWDFPGFYTEPVNREARTSLQTGLSRLRVGEAHIREARDLFRDAAVLDGINADLEAELRRLVKAVNDLLAYRVIP